MSPSAAGPTAMPLVVELSPAPDPARCCALLEGLPFRIFLDSGGAPAINFDEVLDEVGRILSDSA